VCFEKDTNYNPVKNEWVPKPSEIAQIYETLKLLTKKEEFYP
jgi:hypothetical protein